MLTIDTDLFAPAPVQLDLIPAPQRRLITCLVCQRGGWRDSTHDRLCEDCGRSLQASRDFVTTKVLACEVRATRAAETFDAAWQSADDALQTRYTNYETARDADDPRAEQVEQLARSGNPDALCRLVARYLDYADALDAVVNVSAWAECCAEVL